MSTDLSSLLKDHANFLDVLALLESNIDRLENGAEPNYDLMLQIVTYMTEYPDSFHHPKEDIAVQRLAELGAGVESAASELRLQHQRISESGAELLERVKAIAAETMVEKASVALPARRYISAMRKHMNVEEAQIFPLMAKLLGDGDWAYINATMGSFDDPLFGPVAEERYQSLLQHIMAIDALHM